MNIFSLDGDWQLTGFDESEHSLSGPDALGALGISPIPAHVPGNVELDLQRVGKLKEPLEGAAIRDLRGLEGYQWWYLRDFDLPADFAGRQWELICEGLDTLATIWINGKQVGQADNALIEHVFPATEALLPGQTNQIAIRLKSVVLAARGYEYDPLYKSWENREEGLFIRKPAHCWGWDIMPRAVSAGIWRSLRLEEHPVNAIESLYFWTAAIGPGGAQLGVRYQCRTRFADLSGIHLTFEGVCGEHQFSYDWPLEFTAGGCQISIPDAKLWWPRGYGEANLYRVTVRLMRGEEVLAERAERIGLRKLIVRRTETSGNSVFHWNGATMVQVDSQPDPQHHFFIEVNHEPILVKGSNWVPLDAFHSRDLERLERAIALADDLNCNMLRCWGGNVYESDAFFNLCDEKGFMVWQDFAYACSRYPQTEDFLARVRKEAEVVIRRLRNHPSLAVWCGDNEIDMVYMADNMLPDLNRLTREVLPQVLHRADPERTLIPSSPYVSAEVLKTANPMMSTPEQHLWGPRGYFKSRYYTEHNAHFIGEIGYHGCPNPESVRRFVSPDQVWPWQNNDEWQIHSTYHWFHNIIERDRIKLMANQVRELFGKIPEDLETFALASQITQAEAKKYFIESTRLRKWRTSGLIWWNLIDGWPQFSDAVVDYYFEKKLAYHYIRRVQQPVCLIIGEEHEKHLPLIACNDSRRPAEIQYRVWEAGQDKTLLQGSFHLPANQNWCLGELRCYASDQRVLLMEWEVDGVRYGNHALLAGPPVSLEQYQVWLKSIATLPEEFPFLPA